MSRRGRGEGSLYFDPERQRWIGVATLGFDARGKRQVKKVSASTKTVARDKLRELLRDHEDGLPIAPANYTVGDAISTWLAHGLRQVEEATVNNYRVLCRTHLIPELGRRKLRELTADDVDKWLARKSKVLGTRTLRLLMSCLKRAVAFAQARDKVKRNVVALCVPPRGQKVGRPSKSLTLEQAEAVLVAAVGMRLEAYIVVSLLTGARTEELRALTWDHVELRGRPDAIPPAPPFMAVWRSVRAGGDTKTRRSRRTLALAGRCVDSLTGHQRRQVVERAAAGHRWVDLNLVFASKVGTELDAHNVRRDFRRVVARAGLTATDWTPRELRHSFVSLLSDDGMPLENISRLVGHSGTAITEAVYRLQIRPVIEDGATAMDRLFPTGEHDERAS